MMSMVPRTSSTIALTDAMTVAVADPVEEERVLDGRRLELAAVLCGQHHR